MLMAELGTLNLFLALPGPAPRLALTELLLEEIGLNLARDLLTVHQPSLSTMLPCLVLLRVTLSIIMTRTEIVHPPAQVQTEILHTEVSQAQPGPHGVRPAPAARPGAQRRVGA